LGVFNTIILSAQTEEVNANKKLKIMYEKPFNHSSNGKKEKER